MAHLSPISVFRELKVASIDPLDHATCAQCGSQWPQHGPDSANESSGTGTLFSTCPSRRRAMPCWQSFEGYLASLSFIVAYRGPKKASIRPPDCPTWAQCSSKWLQHSPGCANECSGTGTLFSRCSSRRRAVPFWRSFEGYLASLGFILASRGPKKAPIENPTCLTSTLQWPQGVSRS